MEPGPLELAMAVPPRRRRPGGIGSKVCGLGFMAYGFDNLMGYYQNVN